MPPTTWSSVAIGHPARNRLARADHAALTELLADLGLSHTSAARNRLDEIGAGPVCAALQIGPRLVRQWRNGCASLLFGDRSRKRGVKVSGLTETQIELIVF